MKCMPMKRSGRLVCAASCVMEIEDVLLARMAPGRRTRVRFFQHGGLSDRAVRGRLRRRNRRRRCAAMSVAGWMRARTPRLFGFGDFALLHFAVEIFGDGFQAAVEEALFDVAQNHVVARARKNVGDAVAHGAGAEHGDCLDLVE